MRKTSQIPCSSSFCAGCCGAETGCRGRSLRLIGCGCAPRAARARKHANTHACTHACAHAHGRTLGWVGGWEGRVGLGWGGVQGWGGVGMGWEGWVGACCVGEQPLQPTCAAGDGEALGYQQQTYHSHKQHATNLVACKQLKLQKFTTADVKSFESLYK